MSAREAESFGLANLVVGGDQIDDALDDLIAALLATPRDTAAEIKAALRAALPPSGLGGFSPRGRISDELDAARRLARDDE
jgi:enoyl-CoA hydratase/carnithine racemase